MSIQRAEGSIIPLVAGYVAVLLALVVLVVDVTAVQLARARVYDIADTLALDAADALARSSLYVDGLTGTVPLTDETVTGAARRRLEAAPLPAHVLSWSLTDGTGADVVGGRLGATVVLTARIDVPLAGGLVAALGNPVSVTAHSRAEAVVRVTPPAQPGPSGRATPSRPVQ
ncbi:MAG: hypothetical protein IPI32_11710 [Austwickia sp.]|nr:hypothetical protein [Austwickia sp.]MBK8435852.1 hypothetical protein [Austwickia sp.]MBK9101537.1 hypothetical protein [Austwickia sp.]